MHYGDYYWGLYRDNYRDSFPHYLLSIRQLIFSGTENAYDIMKLVCDCRASAGSLLRFRSSLEECVRLV